MGADRASLQNFVDLLLRRADCRRDRAGRARWRPCIRPQSAAPKAEAKPAAKKEVSKPAAKAAAPKAEAAQDLSAMTVAQLKELAKAKGISGISAMKKSDLISALS